MVQLDRSPDDIEGTLSLEGTTLRFDSPSVGIRTIALETVQRVKRIWGSPVLLVHWLEDGAGGRPPSTSASHRRCTRRSPRPVPPRRR